MTLLPSYFCISAAFNKYSTSLMSLMTVTMFYDSFPLNCEITSRYRTLFLEPKKNWKCKRTHYTVFLMRKHICPLNLTKKSMMQVAKHFFTSTSETIILFCLYYVKTLKINQMTRQECLSHKIYEQLSK